MTRPRATPSHRPRSTSPGRRLVAAARSPAVRIPLVDSCYCGLDAIGSCQGSCQRRICADHAAQEGFLKGYRAPLNELNRADWNRHLPTVAEYAYAAGRGARCPECRNADVLVAMNALHSPRRQPVDPVELRIWQYEAYGMFEPLTTAGWGPNWVAAARKRSINPDGYVEGRAVWQCSKAQLDETGQSPVITGTHVRGILGRKRWESRIAWRLGPVDHNGKPVPFDEHILDPLCRFRLPDQRPRMRRASDDKSFVGVAPEAIWDWMKAR